ncbi:MAG: hypothetical protein ACK5ML_12615 [Lachnospiraceae bacterium]
MNQEPELSWIWYILQSIIYHPALSIGLVIIFMIGVYTINMKIRKQKANQFLDQHAGAATMTFFKKKVGDANYADTIRIVMLNGEKAQWFFLRPAIPAIFLKNGENKIELYAEWARGTKISDIKRSGHITLIVQARSEGHYSMEYYIPENRFIFEPYENERIFGK